MILDVLTTGIGDVVTGGLTWEQLVDEGIEVNFSKSRKDDIFW